MSCEAAFRIFPIAHQYDMQLMVKCCVKAFEKNQQLAILPTQPIASSEMLHQPGLIQSLALADAKQCDPLVQSCLSELIKPGTSHVRDALTTPHLDKLIDSLRPETKDKIIRVLVGLPANFKVGSETGYWSFDSKS